jgi:hypothetical protein
MVGGWWRVASSGAGRLGRGASEFAVLENSYLAELILHDFSDCKLFFKSKLEGRIDFEQTKRPGRAPTAHGDVNRRAHAFRCPSLDPLADAFLFSRRCRYLRKKLEGRIDSEQTKRPGRAPTAHGDVNRRAHAFRCPSLDPLADAFLFSRRCRYLRKKPHPPRVKLDRRGRWVLSKIESVARDGKHMPRSRVGG